MAKFDFRRPRVWIPTLLGLLVLGLIVYRVVEARSPQEPAPSVEEIRAESGIPVTVAEASTGPLEVWREFSGSVSGVRDAVVRTRSGDQIASVQVSTGQRVRQGQVLVRQAGETTQARVRQADVAVRQARRTVDRLRPLHEAGAISDQDFDEAVTQLELAQEDLAAARDALALTSPLAGTVTEVVARPGMIPAPGDPLVRVADLSELVVRVQASPAEAAEIREGQTARMTSTGTTGEVRRLALQADPESRLVEVEIAFPPGAGLFPGTLATVEVRVAQRENALRVPPEALQDGFVWLVGEDNQVSRRPVTTGLESASAVEILSGLDPDATVVVRGGSLLSQGARVRVVDRGVEADLDGGVEGVGTGVGAGAGAGTDGSAEAESNPDV